MLAPVYLLHGEEGYYIDRLAEEFEALVPEEERDFNLYILYGADTSAEQVTEVCRRYPMMAERQVVILKEAQAMRADIINKLHTYVSSPSPTTVLAICVRGAQAKGKDLLAALRKGGAVMFESKKLTEAKVAPVIAQLIKEKGLNIDEKGKLMLRDFIGTDVARLYNEIDKLGLILPKGAMVTPEVIERNIGISKDYNNYELIDALATRNAAKVYRITDYFRANPKNNPVQVTVATLFNFFSTLIVLLFNRDKSPSEVASLMGLRSQWQLKNYETAARYYNARQVMEIISALRTFDNRSKGIGSRANPYDLLRDLVFHILTARGDITIP